MSEPLPKSAMRSKDLERATLTLNGLLEGFQAHHELLNEQMSMVLALGVAVFATGYDEDSKRWIVRVLTDAFDVRTDDVRRWGKE